MYILVIKQLGTMLFIVLAGFIFAKAFKFKESEQKFVSKFLLYLINPCLIFTSFDKEFNPLKLKQLLIVIFISLIIHLVMILIATIFTLTKNPQKKTYAGVNRLAIIFTNCGFIGIPLINGIFGDDGVFFLMGYLVIFNIALWTYGYFQMSASVNFKKIITNPNVLAVLLGILIFCLPFRIPQFISKPIEMIGSLNTPTAMILIGMLFANFSVKKPTEVTLKAKPTVSTEAAVSEKKVALGTEPTVVAEKLAVNEEKSAETEELAVGGRNYIFMLAKTIFLRLVLCSFVNLAILFVCYKVIHKIPDSRLMIFVIFISSLCPTATSVPSLACIFEKDSTYASFLVSLSSLFCIISVPLFVALAEVLIK